MSRLGTEHQSAFSLGMLLRDAYFPTYVVRFLLVMNDWLRGQSFAFHLCRRSFISIFHFFPFQHVFSRSGILVPISHLTVSIWGGHKEQRMKMQDIYRQGILPVMHLSTTDIERFIVSNKTLQGSVHFKEYHTPQFLRCFQISNQIANRALRKCNCQYCSMPFDYQEDIFTRVWLILLLAFAHTPVYSH